jgi:hypothetical protein
MPTVGQSTGRNVERMTVAIAHMGGAGW